MPDHRIRVFAAALGLSVAAAMLPAHAAGPSVKLHGHRFSIEIAADDASRDHGLMDRTSMPADHGMLFVFDEPGMLTFWMKNTLIPLDMLFFDEDYRLINMHQRVPPCRQDPCPVYGSTKPAQYVLELNGGEASKIGVKPGDKLTVRR